MQDSDDVNIKEVQMALKKVDKGKDKAQKIDLPESESEERGYLRQHVKPSNESGPAQSCGHLAGRSWPPPPTKEIEDEGDAEQVCAACKQCGDRCIPSPGHTCVQCHQQKVQCLLAKLHQWSASCHHQSPTLEKMQKQQECSESRSRPPQSNIRHSAPPPPPTSTILPVIRIPYHGPPSPSKPAPTIKIGPPQKKIKQSKPAQGEPHIFTIFRSLKLVI